MGRRIVSTPTTRDLLFVYGTLRKAANHRMHQSLARFSTFVGEGRVRGAMYDLGSYPGIVLDDASAWIQGEVYGLDVDHASRTLRVLDEYEGCSPSNPEPHEYCRRRVPVFLDDGNEVVAWAYIVRILPRGAVRVPDGDYLAWLREKTR